MAGENRYGATDVEDSYPLSPLQQGLLFNTLSDPGSGVDIEQLVCELHEPVDVTALQRAWQCVIARHPVLRTNLRWENLPEPRQEVQARVELPWEERDWRGLAGSDRVERFAQFQNADRRRGFELTRAPLFRLTLLRYGEAEFHLMWTVHQAVLEGRSFAVAIPEVFAFYEAFREGKEISLPRPRPYRDYIDWLRQQDFSKDEAFWRQTLKGFIGPTPLAVDHAPVPSQISRTRRATQDILLSAHATSALRKLAQDNGVTLNTIVQGAWALLLNRYSGEADIVIGVIRADGRSAIEGAEAILGLFLNTLPLRVQVKPESALIPWMKEVRLQWMAMRGHEHTQLANIQTWSDVPAGSPLFQSTVMFENYDLDTLLRNQGGAWSKRRFHLFSQSNYPVDVAAFDGTQLRLSIDFDRSRMDDAAAERMINHLRTLLHGMAANPDARLGELPLLTEDERHQLLVEWNDTAVDYPRDTLLHELFEEQAQRTPDEVKVIFEGQTLTNAELEARGNQLAHFLQKRGVVPDTLVAICLERSLEMVVGVLGILKAGGAYVPIDPDLPQQRIAYILEETKSPVVLTQHRLLDRLPPDCANATCLDTDWAAISQESTFRATSRATASNLAYVIYTSGSTGRPKGVMITHAGICNHMHWMKRAHVLSAGDVELQKAPFGFDASVWEFFAPLMTDAYLVMARPDGHLDPVYLAEMIRTHHVSTLQVDPSLLRMLLDEPTFWHCGACLEKVYCGGEPLTTELCDTFTARLPQSQLYNVYGPTEAAIDATYWACPRDDLPVTIPVGRPIDNVRVYIVNPQMQLLPVGVPGELLVGGAGVARGYLNDPKLTAERFIPDPFSTDGQARVYRTGDIARYLPDGNIEYLGRLDHQVQIRGFRIEPGEIEAAIAGHPLVREVLVVAHEFAPADKRLVAYVVAENPPADLAEQLRSRLRSRMPEHMVPAHFISLPALPRTPVGKVDRKQLPVPGPFATQATYVAPRTPTEQAVAATWREVLQYERIGVRDNFFELGGHSLLLVKLISRINLAHGIKLGSSDLVQNPTVEQIAELIDRRLQKGTQLSGIVSLQKGQTGLPVYFIYAGPSEFRIARHMGDSHAVFGIAARWPLAWRNAVSDNRTSDFPSMEQMVAPYVASLSAHVGSSACVLAGFSYAGRIAFEAAHQLQRLGGKVELVILIDSQIRPPNPYQLAWQIWRQDWTQPSSGLATTRIFQSLGSRVRNSWHTTRWLFEKVKNRLWSYFDRTNAELDILTGIQDEQGMPLPWGLLDRLYNEIDKDYTLRSLDSRGALFRTSELDGKLAAYALDEALGWENLFTQGLEIIPIAGDHSSIWGETMPTIARQMDRVIKQCSPITDSKANRDASKA